MLFTASLASILFTLGVIILSCLIMARYRDLFNKVKVPFAIITFIGGLSVYTLGYLPDVLFAGNINFAEKIIKYGSVIFRAMFSTCRAFILESDFSDISTGLQNNSIYVLVFSIIHVMALMLTVLTAISYFGMRFISRIQLLIAKNQEVYVFLGLNESSLYLIKDIRKNGKNRSIVVIEDFPAKDDDESSLVKKIRENRCILIDHNPEEITGIKKLGLSDRLFKRSIHFFLISDNENQNSRTAVSIIEYIRREKIPQDAITLHVRSSDEGVESMLEKASMENRVNIEFKTFSIPDISARQLMEKFPVYETMDLDTDLAMAKSGFTILIAGFGDVGMEVLRKSVYCGQFIGGSYKAFVVDGFMKNKAGRFGNRYYGMNSNYDISYMEAEPGSHEFFSLLKENGKNIKYIVVSLGNDKLNMETAMEIQRLVDRQCLEKNVIIAVNILMTEDFSHYKETLNLRNIHFFGGISDIFTENIIINECMDKMARKMNTMFNEIYNVNPADNWKSLDSFTKESNRSASMNIRTKLKLIGLDMAEKGKEPSKKVDLRDYLVSERLENLAKQEHLRWNAFHFASGWITWELSDTGDTKKAKDLKNRRHACLVSWEGLKAVTAHFRQSPSYEELDFRQVLHIPDILDYSGYEVFKEE